MRCTNRVREKRKERRYTLKRLEKESGGIGFAHIAVGKRGKEALIRGSLPIIKGIRVQDRRTV